MRDFILGCAGVVFMLGMIFWQIILKERRRAKKLEALAPGLGFSMVPQGTKYGFDTPVFHRGDKGSNRMRNAMEGVAAGMRAVLFDLSYDTTTGSGEDTGTTTTRRTAAAFEVAKVALPSFFITTSDFVSRFSTHKIKIDNDAQFAKRFVVTGNDEAAVRALVSPALAQYLASAQLPEKIVIEGAGSWLVLYRRGKRLRPQQWREFADTTSVIAREIIQYWAAPCAQSRCGD